MATTFTKANILKRAALILLALVLTCATAWAEDNSSYFTDNGTAPSWDSSFPTTWNWTAGDIDGFDVTDYVSGNPTPTITLVTDAPTEDYEFEDGGFIYYANHTGTFTFTFTATNELGSADAVLVATVTGIAPSWDSNFPATATVASGEDYEFQNVTAYASGTPSPTVALTSADSDDYLYDNDIFLFNTNTPGTYAFIFTATNVLGTANVTLTVTVTAAPVTVPTLSFTDITPTTTNATWTACEGVSSYTLQLASDNQFTEGSSGGNANVILSEDFAEITSTSTTAIDNLNDYTNVSGWSGTNVFPYYYYSNGSVRLGTSSGAGSIQTPSLSASSLVTVTWIARQWPTDNTSIYVGVSEDGGNSFHEELVDLSDEETQYTKTFTITGNSVIVRWRSSGDSGQRFYLDDITIGSGSLLLEATVNTNEYSFTNLDPATTYYARVKGNSDWSNVVSFTTAGIAPVWSAFPATTGIVGEFTYITISNYVTGTPAPTIELSSSTADADDYVFDKGLLVFEPSATGTYTFTFTAANGEGSAEATLTVIVSAAPVTVPELTVSNVTATTALATWTACDNVSSYTLQLASDDQFTTGGGSGGEVTLFSNNATDPSAAPNDWTYNLKSTSGSYLQLASGHYVITEAFNASACTDLSLSLYMRTYGGTTYPSVTVEYSTDNGATWSESLGTLSAANTTMAQRTLDVSAAAGSSSVRLRIASTSTSASIGVGIKTIVLTGTESASGGGSLISETSVSGNEYTFTGLTPETTYYARVKGNADWSNIEEFTTTAVSTAPSWDSSFPTSATVAAGEYYEFENVSTYASGSPSPTIALTSADSEDYLFDNDTFLFNTIFPGTYHFTFTATNNLGTADVTLTVTVTATTLIGNETSLAAGVYMVNSDITYNSTITLTGDVILILGEGKTMTVNSSSHGIDGATNNKNLTIYGETEQDGTLSVTAVGDGICCENITINSGTVNVTSNQSSSISAQNIITINGGVVTATSESTSSINGNWGVSINGGQVTAAGYYGDIVAYNNSNITLGYTNATDFISFESIDVPGTGSVVIADGKVMTDGTNTYDSNTPSATLEALTNTTLRPVTGIANCDITVPNQTLEGPNNPFENICYKFEYANNNYSESYAQEFIAGMGVVVKDGETVLALGTDYLFGSVTYANGEPITESQIGDECKVEIVGQGNYTGSQWASFTIIAPDASGTWGDSNILTWAFHDGTLSITGTGEMKSAANNNDYPWFSIANYVKTLTIGEGISTVAAKAFAGTNNVLSYGNLTTVNLPSTLTTIGFEAFAYCIGLNTINNFPENATVAEQAFYLVPCVAAVTVTGYGDSELSEKWVFIASPLSGSITPNAAGNLVGSYNSESGLYDYDLYRFNQSSTTGEWENSVQHNTNANPFVLENGKGYLYASKTTKALIFVGTFNTSADTTIALTYDANAQFAGWNLVGNPFNEEAYVNRPFYKMNDEGTDIEPVENYDNYTAVTIPPCTGIMVQAEGENETVRFSTTQPSMTASNNGHLQIALAEQVTTRGGAISNTIDKAILSFNEDAELGKFYFGSQNANIYIPQDNEEYAITFAQKQGEMPLNFKATRHGNYTITVSPAAVEMGYLHLIDHLTGADIDLLQTPSYTFEAKTTDYASRFKLVFAAKDLDTLDDDFAFISNGEIFVNGTGMLQVIDVLGHQLLAKQLLTPNSSLLTPHLPTGVYVLRLVNGEQVRTQKIVVR